MKKIDPELDFEYLDLKSANLQNCRGCYQCLGKGEWFCPVKDDRGIIEKKMMEADGTIFSTPVYVLNVSWIMKNFIDRFAYLSHRPRFHSKRAIVVTTTGAVGLGFVLFMLALEVGTWGFKVVHKLGVITPPASLPDYEVKRNEVKYNKRIEASARKFYSSIKPNKPPKPSLFSTISFYFQRKAFARGEQDTTDYMYWKDKGWLDKGSKYYYNTKINPIKKTLAVVIAKIAFLFIPKPPKPKHI